MLTGDNRENGEIPVKQTFSMWGLPAVSFRADEFLQWDVWDVLIGTSSALKLHPPSFLSNTPLATQKNPRNSEPTDRESWYVHVKLVRDFNNPPITNPLPPWVCFVQKPSRGPNQGRSVNMSWIWFVSPWVPNHDFLRPRKFNVVGPGCFRKTKMVDSKKCIARIIATIKFNKKNLWTSLSWFFYLPNVSGRKWGFRNWRNSHTSEMGWVGALGDAWKVWWL